MRVRMKTNIGGTREGEEWPRKGECLDLADHQARDLIAQGYAEEATDEDASEQSDAPARKQRKRRNRPDDQPADRDGATLGPEPATADESGAGSMSADESRSETSADEHLTEPAE